MKEKAKTYDVGVIVGRFQVPLLHKAHQDLFDYVVSRHKRVHVILGVSPLITTHRNPLPFEARRQMIESLYHNVRCYPLQDVESDSKWVQNLDSLIGNIETTSSVVLYGSRDSFVDTYVEHKGKYDSSYLEPDEYINTYSGTTVRDDVSKNIENTSDFRSGIIWANYHKYPTVYTVVDAIILNSDRTKILLCKKNLYDDKYRFVGGFSDVESKTFEQDAIREIKEETQLDTIHLAYAGNLKIDDWRYHNQRDCLHTMLFVAVTAGDPVPGDDIVSVKWFDLSDFVANYETILVKSHSDIFKYFYSEIQPIIKEI